MNKIKDDAFPSYDEETYSKGLSREDTLEGQIRTCIAFYSRQEWHNFEFSLKALLLLLPYEIRKQFTPLQHDVSIYGVEKHYIQFLKIQNKLEKDTNMVWKKRFVKTYE